MKLFNVSFMDKISPFGIGRLAIYSQKCMWVGMGQATLTVPNKGSNCHVIFMFHFTSKNISIEQLFIDKMLINLLKRVVSLDGVYSRWSLCLSPSRLVAY